MKGKPENVPDGMDRPFLLVNSRMNGFAAGRSSIADARHIEATFLVEDNLRDARSIPQGSVLLAGNISQAPKP